MSLVRILLGLVALASISSQAGATRLWKGGAGVVASTCSAGDFFTAVDGSGNFTCATPAGSGDITAVGDCASGACFSATSGNNSLIFEGATADTFETTLTTIDPSADATVSLPKRTGTLALEKVVNLYDYAACDGTDEATEIQAAITAACALGPGGTLYVPADTCSFASTLTLCSGLAIIGSDSTERVAYGTAQPHELSYSGTGSAIDAQSLSGVRLAGLLLRATSGSFAGPLIDADGIDYLTIDRVMLTAATQAGAATCALLSINDSTDVGVRNSAFYRCGYAIYGRALAANYANVVTLSQNAFYQAEVCSVQNPGDAWMVLGNKWQQQGASDDESSMFCHASGVCSEGFKFSGNMIVDQPNGPTVTELDFCGAGFEISGNYIGGNTTQDGIGFSEPCDGCSVQGNWFGFLDAGVAISSTGSSSESLTILGNDYDTVTTEIAGTRPGRSIMQENTGGTVVNELADIWLNADTDASSGAGAVVIGSNAASTSGDQQYVFFEDGYATFRRGNDLRFYDSVANGNDFYVEFSLGTANLGSNKTITVPDATGTIAVSATAPVVVNATTGNVTLTQNAGTDVTADLEEETHASEHSLGGTDPITVTNLASACTDGQVLGGTAGGTGVECQADVDTNTNASTICAGTTTYLDGEGNCDDISSVYLPLAGGTMTGHLILSGDAGEGLSGGGLADCDNATTSKLLWDVTTNKFSCGTDQTGAGGGDAISVNASPATDPSFNDGDIDWTLGGGGTTITGTVGCSGCVDATDLGADSVGASELSNAAIDEVMAAAVGTGLDLDTATDPDNLDVDVTEVALTKGSIWQGNSSGLATVYSNPSGIDIRTYGALCDGSTDDATAIGNCITDLNAAGGGTCLIPATGTACVIKNDVTLKSNVNLIGTPGARIAAGTGGTLTNAVLNASAAVDNVRVSGIIFNNDQVKIDMLRFGGKGAGLVVDHNKFFFNYDGDGASTNTTAFDYLEIGCTGEAAAILDSQACLVESNQFLGSDTDGQNDRGINITGDYSLFAATMIIAHNEIIQPGGDCMNATANTYAIVDGNILGACHDDGIGGTWGYADFVGNHVNVDGSDGGIAGNITCTNCRIVGNVFPIASGGRGAFKITNGSGTQFSNNYAADGVQYVVSTATTALLHPSIKNNVFNIGTCADDPIDGGSLVSCVHVQNPTDGQVVSNTFVGTAPAGGASPIRIINRYTTTQDLNQVRILNNIVSMVGAAGTDSCIDFDDQSGGTNNGFVNVQMVGNSCGFEGLTAPENCVKISNVAETANWADVFYSANIFDDCTTWQSGASTTNVTPQVFNSAGTSFKWEPRGMNDGFQFRSIHMMGDGNCVPAAGTGYLGPISTGGNNCNATETNVDWSVGPNAVSFTNMTCRQNEDTSCTTVFTLRDDAANTAATCTTTNNDTCAWSGTVTMAASSLAAISMTTNTSCTTESNVECDLTFTVD